MNDSDSAVDSDVNNNPSSSLSQQRASSSCDYTKTRAYAWLDLITKIISAAALASLGLAGWLLQSRSEQMHENLDSRERAERTYLPMLRSLSELELVLGYSTSALSKMYPGGA